MDHRKMTEGQRAYEAKRAAKAGMSLERWLDLKAKEGAAERAAVAKAQQAEATAAGKKPVFCARLLEKAQKPIGGAGARSSDLRPPKAAERPNGRRRRSGV